MTTAPALNSRRTVRIAVVDVASLALIVLVAIAAAMIGGWYAGEHHHVKTAQIVAARQIVDQAAGACLDNHAYDANGPQQSRIMFAQCLDDYEGMVAGSPAIGPLYIPKKVRDALGGHGCHHAWLEVDVTGDAQWYCR